MASGKRDPRIDLNPSSAERWTTCTASPKFIFDNWDKLPPGDTFYNQEGTTAHEVAAALLQNREVNPANCPVPVDEEMSLHAWSYAEYVLGLLKPGGTLLVEQKLPLFYMPERNAVIDVAILNPDEVHIVDLKYGAGVMVDPEENLQEIIYARTVTYRNVPKSTKIPVFLHIYQPRGRDSDGGPAKVWETTWLDISKRGGDIFTKADNILHISKGEVPRFTPSVPRFAPSDKACQWCPAKGFCTARQLKLTEGIEALAVIKPGPKHLPPAASISMKQLQAILEHGSEIKKWIGDAEDYALQFMKGGGKIPGHKLVLSRGGNRFWSNPKVAAKLLLANTVLREDEVYTQTVIGPAAAEKKLGKHKFDAQLTNLISRPAGVPVIAPLDDKREEYGVDLENEFEALDELGIEDI
jgi:hypothetical protein